MNMKTRFVLILSGLLFPILLFAARSDRGSVELEERIRNHQVSSRDLIVSHHPRLWACGESEWDMNKMGSIAWRITHGALLDPADDQNDQARDEFYYVAYIADDPDCFGVTDAGTFGRRFLWTILAGHARKYHWDQKLPSSLLPYSSGTYEPKHTADDYYDDARKKMLALERISNTEEGACWICQNGSVGYDWLVDLTYSSGRPVLSDNDKKTLQKLLIRNAEFAKNRCTGRESLFLSQDIAKYSYCMVGMALYEPSRQQDAEYKEIQQKAKQYLDDFDAIWVGKILPALNAQGGDGGWHGGFDKMTLDFDPYYSENEVLPWHIAPILFAHYTATGMPIEKSLFSTEVIRHGAEFQNYMIRPDGNYYPPVPEEGMRLPWVAPMRMYARRRFSQDAEQKKIGELGAWIRAHKSPDWFVDAGSYDLFEQTLFEDKWINPRPPAEIGFPCSRWFENLGWVFLRDDSESDAAVMFVCQDYVWSPLQPYLQNSFILDYKGRLVDGMQNTLVINGRKQRRVNHFPTIRDGLAVYKPGTKYDIGPGILRFDSSPGVDYVIADAANAYNESVKTFKRFLIWLKEKQTLILLDAVEHKHSPFKIEWCLQPSVKPVYLNNGMITIDNGNGKVWIKCITPAAIRRKLNRDLLSIEFQNPDNRAYLCHLFYYDTSDGHFPNKLEQISFQGKSDHAILKTNNYKIRFNDTGSVQIDLLN